MLRKPPDILITTPESLYLLLTSQGREMLRSVRTLILDEVHAVAGTKRGAHLAVSVERLDRLVGEPVQRVGLSATQRPIEEIGRFVSGARPIRIVDAGTRKELDLRVVVPVEDMRELGSLGELTHPVVQDGVEMDIGTEVGARSIWPSIYPALLELVREHRSTIVFVNNRRLAERLALRLNELAADSEAGTAEIARAHHGSLAREQRVEVEELLKRGEIPCLVATSSLELGIDMGAVDLVIQVESPKSVARGLQRIGRAGHELGATSKGRIFPKFRADLLESAVVAERMLAGEIEETVIPKNPLDVLAQQIVAVCADEEVEVGRAPRPRPRRLSVRRPVARAARERARHALRSLSVRRVRRPEAAHRLGPHGRHDPRSRGRAAAGRHQRGHDPRPRPFRRAPRQRRRAGRRARRGDGLRGESRSDVPARRVDVAHRGDHPRPGDRLAGSGRTGRRSVLEGRGCGAPLRAGRADRPRVPRAVRALRRPGDRTADHPAHARRPRGAQPAHVPARAGGGDPRRPIRPDDRGRALPRRDRRLAGLHPHAVRRPGARAVGDGGRSAVARRPRDRGAVDLVGRRDRLPSPRCRRPSADRGADPRSGRARGSGRRRGGADRALRLALPRERRPGAADPAPSPRRAHAALAAASEGPVAAPGRAPLPGLPDHPRDLPRVPPGRLRSARAEATAPGPARADDRRRRRRDRLRVALFGLAPLRLRRDVHVRGRHAAGRAPRAGPLARPRPAPRAARAGGAARPDRPRGARGGRRVLARGSTYA